MYRILSDILAILTLSYLLQNNYRNLYTPSYEALCQYPPLSWIGKLAQLPYTHTHLAREYIGTLLRL